MSTSSKRTKATTATNGHIRTQATGQAISIAEGHGLAALAVQLADTEDLFKLTVTASCAAKRQSECTELPSICRPSSRHRTTRTCLATPSAERAT